VDGGGQQQFTLAVDNKGSLVVSDVGQFGLGVEGGFLSKEGGVLL
jgi:hypothetical protein